MKNRDAKPPKSQDCGTGEDAPPEVLAMTAYARVQAAADAERRKLQRASRSFERDWGIA